jgi:hypothetical protein
MIKVKFKKYVAASFMSVIGIEAFAACETNYNINLQTFGENVKVELRSGAPGNSKVVGARLSGGGRVTFNRMCSGSYFLAIGNEDSVSVTPTRYFDDYSEYESTITLQRGAGNVSKRARSSL